jgi:hypothetical protein
MFPSIPGMMTYNEMNIMILIKYFQLTKTDAKLHFNYHRLSIEKKIFFDYRGIKFQRYANKASVAWHFRGWHADSHIHSHKTFAN